MTEPKSIETLSSWLTEIEENSNEKVEIIIAGNKKDLHRGEDIILPESIARFKGYLTSAKNGHNIGKMFSELTATVLTKLKNGEIQADGNYGVKRGNSTSKGAILKRAQPPQEESSGCC